VGIGQLKINKVNKNFDKNVFLQEYEETFESKAGFTQKKTFAPSTIGYGHGKCARYWFLAFNGAEFEDNNTLQAKANMENGTFTHDRLQNRFSKMNKVYKVVEHETEILSSDPPIRGFRDTLFVNTETGEEIPFEIKSMKDDKFYSKKISEIPEPNHLLQLLIYMREKGHKTGVFFYENKNDQEPLLITIEMNKKNQELLDYVYSWLKEVYKAYEDNTLPNRAGESKTRMPCSYCPVKKVCWKDMKDQDGEIIIELMETS